MTRTNPVISHLSEFRKLVIQAIFSDDDLSNLFSLKGGSALDLIHNITYRSSIDVDVAMQDDISPEKIQIIANKLETALQSIFNEYDPSYSIFQFKFEARPAKQNIASKKEFWGGYRVEFKIRKGIYPIDELPDPQKAAREAEVINPSTQSKKFMIDISKYEFTNQSEIKYLEGYPIKVYTLEMIVYEKLRAICQKLPIYEHAHKDIQARPKDFYDIYMIMDDQTHIKFESLELDILEKFFDAKNVPLHLLFEISNFKKEIFDTGLLELKDTLYYDELKAFDPDKVFEFIIDGINRIPNIDTINKKDNITSSD
jgi:hypothetical protein